MHEGRGDIFESTKADAKKGLHYYSVHVVEEPNTTDGMFYMSAGYLFHMFICKTAHMQPPNMFTWKMIGSTWFYHI